jgi:hypothetical protein
MKFVGYHNCCPDPITLINDCVVIDEQDAMVARTVLLVETDPHLRAKEIADSVSREFEDKHKGNS